MGACVFTREEVSPMTPLFLIALAYRVCGLGWSPYPRSTSAPPPMRHYRLRHFRDQNHKWPLLNLLQQGRRVILNMRNPPRRRLPHHPNAPPSSLLLLYPLPQSRPLLQHTLKKVEINHPHLCVAIQRAVSGHDGQGRWIAHSSSLLNLPPSHQCHLFRIS